MAIKILFRYAVFKGVVEDEGGEMGLAGFADVDKVSPYAYDSMRWAMSTGIITSRTDGTLDPVGNVKRCELAGFKIS